MVFPASSAARHAVAALVLGCVLSGCGGISEHDGAQRSPAAPSGTDAASGMGGAPSLPPAEPSALVLRFAAPLAQPDVGFDPFSLEPPVVLAFSPDGSRLAFAPSSAAREYDAATGVLLSATTDGPLALARNHAFTLELENDGGALALRELPAGAVRWRVPAPPGLLVAAFSDDDGYAVALGCSQAGAALERFRVSDGAGEPAIPLGRCLGSRVSFDVPLPTLVVRSSGAEAIVTAVSGDSDPAGDARAASGDPNANSAFDPNIDEGAAWRVELESGALTAFHAVAAPGTGLLAFAAAAGGGGFAALGTDGGVVFRSGIASEPAWPAVAASTAKLSCYFVPPVVLPLAVSADARLLAAGTADGHALVLRRTSDGVELARTAGPGAASCDVGGAPPLPMLAAFDRDAAALAVVWDETLAVYDVK